MLELQDVIGRIKGRSSNLLKEEVRNYLCNKIRNLDKLIDSIYNTVAEQNKSLYFWTEEVRDSYFGKTCEEGEKIHININISQIKDIETFDKVIIHELGEVDYILRGFPKVYIEEEKYNEWSVLMELISHKHINQLLKYYGLENYSFKISETVRDSLKKLEKLDCEWYKMLCICHNYATYMEESIDIKQVVNSDCESKIEKIKTLIDECNTIDKENAKIDITNTMSSIIKVLMECGMGKTTIIQRK